jgi:hypothetical protein
MAIVELFSDQDHSGFSASIATGMINRLLKWENLSPVEDKEELWVDVTDGLFQHKNAPGLFKNKGEKPYYLDGLIFRDEDEDGGTYTSSWSKVEVELPWRPPTTHKVVSSRYEGAPIFMIDVESIGLTGESYAIAWTVMELGGKVLEQGAYSVDPTLAEGTEKDRAWVMENIPPLEITHFARAEMAEDFWSKWVAWREKGAFMAVDHGIPVESNFLAYCLEGKDGIKESPYPLLDVSSMQAQLGHWPAYSTGTPRAEDELPVHDPKADTLRSARQLVRAFTQGVI